MTKDSDKKIEVVSEEIIPVDGSSKVEEMAEIRQAIIEDLDEREGAIPEDGTLPALLEPSDLPSKPDRKTEKARRKVIKKRAVRDKKIRRAVRRNHFRRLKNFFWWLGGVLSSVGIVFGSIFIAVGVIPVGTYIGSKKSEYMTEEVYDKALLGILLNFGDLRIDDFPIIEKTLGDALGENNQIGAFVDYQELKVQPTLNENYTLTEKVSEAKNYYAVSNSGPVASDADAKVEYERAFDDAGVLKEKFRRAYDEGTLKIYLQPLFSKPILEGLSSLKTYLDYVEVADVLKITGMDEGSLVYELMTDIYVGDFLKSSNDGGFSAEKILNNATFDKLGGVDVLGDLGNFIFFKEYEKVKEKDYPEVEEVDGALYITKEEGEDADFTSMPALYYIGLSEDEYVRAFDDDGKFIGEYAKADGTPVNYANLDEVKTADKLFYANLSKTPITSALDLIGESLFRQEMLVVLENLGMDINDDATIKDVFDGQTVESLSKSPEEGGFDFKSIKLSALIGKYNENNGEHKELYDTLLAISGEKPAREEGEEDQAYDERVSVAADELKISSLTEDFSKDKIKIKDLIELEDKTLDMLCESINVSKKEEFEKNPENEGQAYVPVTKDSLSVSDFSYFKTDNVKLSSLLELPTAENEYKNKNVYDILIDATSAKSYGEINVSSLSDFQTKNIKLTTVLPKTDNNKTLYDILLEVTMPTDPTEAAEWTVDKITVDSLSSFSTTNVKLITVLPKTEDNASLYDIILEVTGKTSVDEVTFGSLNSFTTNNIKLTTMGVSKDSDIYKILDSAIDDAKKPYDVENGENKYYLTIGSITAKGNFEVGNIKLGTVGINSTSGKIYTILKQATGKDDPTIGDLTGSGFNTGNIKLSAVLNGDGGNVILEALLSDDNVTIGNLGEKINGMKLYDIYGKSCFTTNGTGDKFTRTESNGVVTYTRDPNGTYYINQASGIWLLLSYKAEGVDADTGVPDKYVSANTTMGTLQTDGKLLGTTFLDATIYQLQEAGLINISGLKDEVARLSIKEVIEKLNGLPS